MTEELSIEQNGAKGSTNHQNNDMSTNNNLTVINNGISYSDARQIALDVYKTEAQNYAGEAYETSKERTEKLIDAYLEKLFSVENNNSQKLKSPSMQQALFYAQKGYAVDDTGLTKDNYVELLLSRIGSQDRSILQISIDEAIKTIEKLTFEQMDCLSFIFLIFNPQEELTSFVNLKKHFDNLCELYHPSFNLPMTPLYLKSVNTCVSFDSAKQYIPIEDFMGKSFPGLFFKGFDSLEFTSNFSKPIASYRKILLKDIRNSEKLQINAINEPTLNSLITGTNMEEDREKIVNYFKQHIMNTAEIREDLLVLNSKMQDLLETWKNSDLKFCQLTPVGIIIAITNYNKKFNKNIDYSKYIH